MNILLLGSGGREHTFAWKMSKSPLCSQLFIAPGNAGTADCGTNLVVDIADFTAIKKIILQQKIQMVEIAVWIWEWEWALLKCS